jgi:archaellum component FlaC
MEQYMAKKRVTVSELSENVTDLLKLVEGYTKEVNLLHGAGNESVPTRLKVLEGGLESLAKDYKELLAKFEKCKEHHGAKTDIDIVNLQNDVSNLQKALESAGIQINTRLNSLDKFRETYKASWKNYIFAAIKFVATIATAYIIFKLTGK